MLSCQARRQAMTRAAKASLRTAPTSRLTPALSRACAVATGPSPMRSGSHPARQDLIRRAARAPARGPLGGGHDQRPGPVRDPVFPTVTTPSGFSKYGRSFASFARDCPSRMLSSWMSSSRRARPQGHDREDLAIEAAGVAGLGRAVVALGRVAVALLAGDPEVPGEELGGLLHEQVTGRVRQLLEQRDTRLQEGGPERRERPAAAPGSAPASFANIAVIFLLTMSGSSSPRRPSSGRGLSSQPRSPGPRW